MSKHLRPETMQYVSDFPKGKKIVLVYPEFGDIIRWVPVKDQHGFDHHEPETFVEFTMNFSTEAGKHRKPELVSLLKDLDREIVWTWEMDEI